MQFDKKNYSGAELLNLYRNILLSRMIEEKMLFLLRQGRVGKWFSGIGQEAISVGATLAMQEDEWIMPLHRNLGVFISRGMPLSRLMNQWQGHTDGYSKGRERSFHFGSREHYICGMISHLGPQLAVADGVALAYKLQKQQKASLAFTGEGGTSEGDFHEALNTAAVWDLPVIFIIENNGYGLSTPVAEQYRCSSLAERAKGYGMEGVCIDGNNVLTVYDTIKGVREYCIKNQKPYLVECMTFRMRGHEEASGVKYVPGGLFEEWGKKDPVKNYEDFLLTTGVLNAAEAKIIREELSQTVEEELVKGLAGNDVVPDSAIELQDVYADMPLSVFRLPKVSQENPEAETTEAIEIADDDTWPPESPERITLTPAPDNYVVSAKPVFASGLDQRSLRLVDAVREGLHQSMKVHENLILMGQDIAAYGGAFKVTEGFIDEFGKHRVRNTPLCESAIIGAALGLSLEGFKSMVEMQFADFVSCGFNQIVNNLAKIHYRWGQHADVVIRMPAGGGIGAGPFHSQSNEAWFVHTPGLKVVYPSNPGDAKGLVIAAINDPNPVIFFEHKALYRSVSGHVHSGYYEVDIGSAKLAREGDDVSIITYGSGVHWAMDYADAHKDVSLNILDLRTLLPLDYDAIKAAVHKTGKVLLLHEDTLTGGIGGEIAAWICEHCFGALDAPVMRCASLDTPVPFNTALEKNFLAKSRLEESITKLLGY